MNEKEKALKICQNMGVTTLFTKDCNNGYTLPLRVAKILAKKVVDEIEQTGTLIDRQCGYLSIEKQHKEYWVNVRAEIEKL